MHENFADSTAFGTRGDTETSLRSLYLRGVIGLDDFERRMGAVLADKKPIPPYEPDSGKGG